ncbi:hypothetical protein BST61_g1953 [Cercospora zeina]
MSKRSSHSSSSTSTISTSTTAHVADFILQGLGRTSEEDGDRTSSAESSSREYASKSSSRTSTPATITAAAIRPSTSSSPSSSFPTLSVAKQNGTSSRGNVTAISGNITGFAQGFAAASSCQADLFSWLNASRIYLSQHAAETSYHSEFSEITWTFTSPATMANLGGAVMAASLTTLCDGNPRAIGSGLYLSSSTIAGKYYTQTITHLSGPYPTPAPCTIGAAECTELHDWFDTAKLKVLYTNQTLYEPPCPTSGTAIPTGKAWCQPPYLEGYGDFMNQVMAEHAQLLYWPVQVKEPTDDTLFCYKAHEDGVKRTAETIPGTRTGDGPNTIVTDGVTITSPMVAMVYTSVHRADGCGPTIAKTIRTMQPDHLSSIRRDSEGGAPRYPFDYNDLNWMCDAGNGTYTMQYVQQDGNCYQNVPAAAYFHGPQKWMQYLPNTAAVKGTIVDSWTILNDYEPYIIEEEVFTQELHDLYGTNAGWIQFGIWDPPVALIQQTAAAKPTLPNARPATPAATTTRKNDPAPTPATPAQPVGTQLRETGSAVPDAISRPSTGENEDIASTPPQQTEGSPSLQNGMANDEVPPQSNGSNNDSSGTNGNSDGEVRPPSHGNDSASGNGEVPAPSHGPVQEDTDQSQDSGQQEQRPPAPILAIGSVTLTQQPAPSGATGVVFQDAEMTLTLQAPGESVKAVTIDSWTLTPSAAPGGVHVFQNGETAFTVHTVSIANPAPGLNTPADSPAQAPPATPAAVMHNANAILTLNAMTLTASPAADHEVLFNAQTTVTVHMGEAVIVESHEISAMMSDGLPRLAVSSVVQEQSQTSMDGVDATTAVSSRSSASQTTEAPSGTPTHSPSAIEVHTGGSERATHPSMICIISIAFACLLL